MDTILVKNKKLNVLKRGWQKDLAKLAGCTPATVINSLHHNAKGIKAERVRQLYMAKYGNND